MERDPFRPEMELSLRLQAKRELRKRMSKLRLLLPLDQRRAANSAICASILERLEGVRSLALFRAIGSKGEIDLTAVDTEARNRGIRVAYPTIDDDEDVPIEDCTMSFRFTDRLEHRGRGFEEPPRGAEVARELDVVVVPALAFDDRGYRLGYGAGLYDKTLPRLASARTIGVAYDFQLLVDVPRSEGDVPVQTVVTDKRVIEVAR